MLEAQCPSLVINNHSWWRRLCTVRETESLHWYKKAASSLPRVLLAVWRHVSSLQWVTARRLSVTWSAVMHHTLWGASEAARVLALLQLGRTCTTYVPLTWSAVALQRFTSAVFFFSLSLWLCRTSCLQVRSFMFNKSALEPSVRTHPGLVEAAMLAAHAEGLDGWRRLLRHQQSLLQLDLLLQLHQHGRLHAVPEGHNGGYMCSFVFWNAAPSSSFTHLETMRPISSRQRQTCRGSLCSTEGKKTKKTKKNHSN